jgi:hypothetical protein
MSQPAVETTATPPTLTIINPTQDDTAQVEEETTLTALEERQNLLAHHVRLVARKLSVGLFVFGSQGGLGKSRTVLRTLAEEGISPTLINSHVTLLSLFKQFFDHRSGAVLFFDDVDSIFASMPHLGLLRSALWGDPRVVHYGSSQLPADLPSSFIFESRLIFAANVIPRKNDAFKAVLSRCDIFELSASQEEVVDLMRSIATAGYETLTPAECLEVVDFIESNGDDRAISLRLLEPSFRKVIYARSEGLDWRPLVMTQLKTLGRKEDTSRRLDARANEIRLLHQAIERFPHSVNEQQSFWSKATGKSRASFFRLLSRQRLR